MALGGVAEDAQHVLAEMDAASAKFRSVQADFVWVQLMTDPVPDTDTQKGSIVFLRRGTETQMAARITEQNGKPVPKDLVYSGGELEFYQPTIQQLTIFSAGANRAQYESFLTLGFGGSGKDLEASWEVSYQGEETIDGVRTAKLDLVPKQASVKQNFAHVTIWVDPARAVSLKQQFFSDEHNSRTATYSNIRYNQPVAGNPFHLKIAAGTQVVHK